MKLTKAQFCEYVNTYEQMMRQNDNFCDILHIDFNNMFFEWLNNYYAFLSDMCELDENCGQGTCLDWYCFETDFGKDKESVKVYEEGKEWPWIIDSPEILYDFITKEE